MTPNLAKAIIAVMKSVKGIEKNLNVGTGNSSYKGVADQDVKNIIGAAMEKNGLCILPVGVDAKTQIDRWEENTVWDGKPQTKQKQQVFTEVKTTYLLLHESGESMTIEGYGHGVDTQDKSAGKATTYALKYALLYAFLVPTGKIDDADNHSSDEYGIKQVSKESIMKQLENCKSKADVVTLFHTYEKTVKGDTSLQEAFKSKQSKLAA
jgi:hypothetical protein